ELQWIAATRGLARDDVDHVLAEQPAIAQGPLVCDEADVKAAPDQLDTERLGRKQMAASAARGEKNQGGSVHGSGIYSEKAPIASRARAPGAAQRAALRGVVRC